MFRPKREDRANVRSRIRWRRNKGDSLPVLLPQPDRHVEVTERDTAPESTRSEFSDDATKTNTVKHRLVQLFHSDARTDENLNSLKRRVVQVRRQPDSAPVRFQMGFRSRTGWEPIRATKENQDCLVALVPWGPGSQYNLFAALDGHGRWGHTCAIFVAQRIVNYLAKVLKVDSERQYIVDCLHSAMLYAEKKLEKKGNERQTNHDESTATPTSSPSIAGIRDVDFRLSGSTGVFVLVHNATLFCANVGDSRALVGREVVRNRDTDERRAKRGKRPPGLSKYKPVVLSVDQKPSRPDEKERLLSAGARVDAWEGVDVGEERVWLPEARTPGLAVSRSFGDLLVKEYGVSCVPEIYTLELSEGDRFVVMASDGVFEFVSNEEVVKLVGKWRDTGSAQEAAQELVKLAVERWIEDDGAIDDVSCVVVFMNVVAAEVNNPCEATLVQSSIGSAKGEATASASGSASGDDADALQGLSSSVMGLGGIGRVDSRLGMNGSGEVIGGGSGDGGGGGVDRVI